MAIASGVIGSALAASVVWWLAGRAVPEARVINGRYILEYRVPAKVLGWLLTAIGVFVAYAAYHASPEQRVAAAIVGGTFAVMSLYVFLEVQFVRIEFDDAHIYTFGPWRRSRVIPWSAVIGYRYSAVNGWHILKTRGYGSIRLSRLPSGLATMSRKWAEKCGASKTV